MLPHRHDNSNLCRGHKLKQLPSCLPSSKQNDYTFSFSYPQVVCAAVFSSDCNATGGHCPALLLTLNPAVDWNQCQDNLQRGCVATATTDRRRVSSFASTAAYAQASEHHSLILTLHTMSFLFTINKVHVLDMHWNSGAWPPTPCSIKFGLCAHEPKGLC